jgi:DGQHR domain-containing protein
VSEPSAIHRRALLVQQNSGVPIYLFALTATELEKVAEISRVSRDSAGELIGYQRAEVKRHVANIVEYLDSEDAILPNAIILALSSRCRFTRSRGPNVDDGVVAAGSLEIPIVTNGEHRPAWIVDGQQRSIALQQVRNRDFPIPVTAFVADTVDVQRDQFVRVNSAKPLPAGLVTELLPKIAAPINPNLSMRKIPSAIVDQLNSHETSPFLGLIKRASMTREDRGTAVVTDTSLVKALEEALQSPSSCLFPYRNVATGETDLDGIWSVLLCYWSAVRDTFPEAWGLPPTRSRLMHGVGIRAMSRVMDRIMPPIDPTSDDAEERVRAELQLLVPVCAWTSGTWDELGGIPWNQLQNVPRDIKVLSNFLIRAYVQAKADRR